MTSTLAWAGAGAKGPPSTLNEFLFLHMMDQLDLLKHDEKGGVTDSNVGGSYGQ